MSLPTLLRETFSSQAFIAGITGTLVGAAISLFGQHLTMAEGRRNRAEDRKHTQIAQASRLVFKLIQIVSNIQSSLWHFERCFALARQRGDNLDQPFVFCQLIANIPLKLHFEAEELSLMLQLQEVDLFNKVAGLDSMHNSFIEILNRYNDERIKLTEKLTVQSFDPQKGVASGTLSPEQSMALQPYMHQCNLLVKTILDWKPNIARTKAATLGVAEMCRQRLRFELKLQWLSAEQSA